MNFEYFIAKKVHYQQRGTKNVSRPATKIATIGIAVGLAVMIVAVCVSVGFKSEITRKTITFGSHIQISNYDNNNSYEMEPISIPAEKIKQIEKIPAVNNVQKFITKPGIIKTDNDFRGIVLKGVGEDYNWNFFNENMIAGNRLKKGEQLGKNQAIVSKFIANKLNLKLGDSFLTYFIQDQTRVRKLKVAGIYSTNFASYDEMFVLINMATTQKLNNWSDSIYSGVEINLKKFDELESTFEQVYKIVGSKSQDGYSNYLVQTIKQISPQIFSWLDLLDMNVWVILVLMLAVAGFNIISGLLILILEKTNMIGILKAMGATDWSIRKIFLYQSIFLIAIGMIIGNVVGLLICFLQYQFHIIPLDPASYYVSNVPIEFNILYLLLLNAGTMIVSILMLVGPSYLITKLSPAKTIKFE